MKQSNVYRSLTTVVLLVVALVALLMALGMVVMLAEAGNKCQGKSCEPLPDTSKACDGPASNHNPHCNPVTEQATKVVTQIPLPTEPAPATEVVPALTEPASQPT